MINLKIAYKEIDRLVYSNFIGIGCDYMCVVEVRHYKVYLYLMLKASIQ